LQVNHKNLKFENDIPADQGGSFTGVLHVPEVKDNLNGRLK